MKNIFYALVGLFLWVSCEETDEHLPPQFNYEIPPTELSDDVLVGASIIIMRLPTGQRSTPTPHNWVSTAPCRPKP